MAFHRRIAILASLACVVGCSGKPPPVTNSKTVTSPFADVNKTGSKLGSGKTHAEDVLESSACPTFTDAHEAAGLVHVYNNGARGKSLMVEAIGGGAGWLDFDGDGNWDIYLNQGGDPAAPADDKQPFDRLFRNMGGGKFADVTAGCRILEFGYGQGVAVGDFDGDGFDDVYVTNVGGNTLWQNLGDGTFRDVTAMAGVADGRWSSSAAWADLDQDGDLDLYVCNYTIYDPKDPLDCRDKNGKFRTCHPRDVEPWPDECYMNQGDGTFTPQAKLRGLFGPGNKALGVAVADFNNDGLPDIYIANDTTANFLFINQGRGNFTEQALKKGCAVDRNGANQASMGLAVGDYDGDGWLDIYSTHFEQESNTLYKNLGWPAGFQDVTGLAGLHDPTLPFLGFGTVMADFNQDGKQELFVTNGHIENNPDNLNYAMTAQIFTYRGERFLECTAKSGEFFRQKRVGRGVAACDYDDDGDLDMVVVHQNSPLALLRNDSKRGHWLKVRFRGLAGNRRGIGARVTVKSGERTLIQELCGGTSYASTHQPVLIFGLGEFDQPCTLTIRWPTGRSQQIENVTVDQSLVFDEPK